MHGADYRKMIKEVASALGTDFCREVVFVGGCTTGLLITDSFALDGVRHTDDVDLIVNTIGYMGYAQFQQVLRQKGFRDITHHENTPVCAMQLGSLRVDFMPADGSLGFNNKWYAQAFTTATDYQLDEEATIRLVTPVYFIATKFEAYLGRGRGDLYSSQDSEDILMLFDGRVELVEEILSADVALQHYIAEQVNMLLQHQDIRAAVDNITRSDKARSNLIHIRLKKVTSGIV